MFARILHRGHRGLAAAHRGVLRLDRLLAEIAVALAPPGLDRAAAADHYRATSIYARPDHRSAGLYPFEERALSAFFPPPPARLFLPGAGGGRELLALVDRGYAVDALEPVPALADAARRALNGLDARGPRGLGTAARTSSVRRASLEEWVEAPVGSYDGIFTGWGLWSHLVERAARLRALRAFRAACPRGPVLLSFWRRERVFDPEERWGREGEPVADDPSPLAARVQAVTRGFLRARVLRLPPVEPGTVWRAGLFVHAASEAELRDEASACGYRLAHYERDGSRYPSAVLVPVELQ